MSEVKLTSHESEDGLAGEIRLVMNGGGPFGFEVLFKFDERGATISVWNPAAPAREHRQEDGYERGRWMVLKRMKVGEDDDADD